MNSKRQLYKPAPKQKVDQNKKVRKLVQGKLELSSHLADHDSTLSATMSDIIHEDPIMSPRRSVPALTEQASPRAEPPSRCLDLSDTELNLSITSSTSTNKQQAIMVCDASHLASSPDSTEVEVVVNYEESPARIVCHTPDRSNRSSVSSSRALYLKKEGFSSVTVDSPKTMSFRHLNSGHEKASEKTDRKNRISEHSRGIIKEILAEEMDSKDIDSISLYSHNSSPSILPKSSSPLEISKNFTSSVNSYSLGVELASNDKSSNSKDILVPVSYRRLNFDEDSDASNCENNVRQDRIDRTPKIEAAKALALKQDGSDSETCSLYEYVSQKKTSAKEKKSQSSLENKSHEPVEVVKKPRSTKKKPGRVVASRFMHSATAVKGNQSSLASAKDSTAESSTNSQNRTTKPQIMSKSSLKPATSTNKLLNIVGKPYGQTTPGKKYPAKKAKDLLTSTPTDDHSCYLYEMDASSIHQSSTLAINDNSSDNDNHIKRNLAVGKSKTSSDKVSLEEQQLQLDLQYTKYLQALYLKTHAFRSFKEQEKQAMKQLNGLWMLREKKRVELAQSRTELGKLKSLLEIDRALDQTETQLASLEEKLPQVGLDYSNLCLALNNTQHQIATSDIHVPNKTEEEREAFEEKLELTLRESEKLLDKITSKIDNKLPTLHQYVACLEAINGNVQESGSELCAGHKNLDVAKGLCSQLSSRMVLAMQKSS